MEGRTNFSRRLEQFDGLTWLALALGPNPNPSPNLNLNPNPIANKLRDWPNIAQFVKCCEIDKVISGAARLVKRAIWSNAR